MKPLSLTIRWWHWVLLALVLVPTSLIATAYTWRSMGHAHYLRTIDQLRSKGKTTSIDDFVALAPAVNVALQDEWDSWQKSFDTFSVSSSMFDLADALGKHQEAWDRWVTGRGLLPAEIEKVLAARSLPFDPAIRMLRTDELVLSGFGWAAQDLPPGKRRVPFTANLRLPQLLAVKELALWLRYSAILAENPREHLDDLDALHSAMRRPGTLIDAMVAIAVTQIRDRAYGDLALQGRLPDDSKQTWIAEPPRWLKLVGDAFEGESVLMGMGAAAMIEVTPITEYNPGWSNWKELSTVLSVWLNGYRDCAIMVDLETHAAQRLRGERSDTWPAWSETLPRLGALGRISIPNLTEACLTAILADALHRKARVAVRVIEDSRFRPLPVDQNALLTRLGSPNDLTPPDPDQLHLRYESLGPRSFRLVIDPGSPIPNFDDPSRMPLRTKFAGAPPSKEPLVWGQAGGVIEIQLPPPPKAP